MTRIIKSTVIAGFAIALVIATCMVEASDMNRDLIEAAIAGHWVDVKDLLNSGANIDTRNNIG